MKGIYITKENQTKLAVQYGIDIDDADDLVPVGYILLADFGSDYMNGTLTQSGFDLMFNKGQAIENDYFVVTVK